MHIFDTDIKAVISGGKLKGVWTKNYYDDYVIPFEAEHGQNYRFEKASTVPTQNFTGSWDMIFDHEGDTTICVAIIAQVNDKLTGTILTPVGDYRYLEGQVDGDQLMLSTFDGGHAFLFTAQGTDTELQGDYWSGKSWHETWTAVKNDSAKLPDEDQLTYLVDGADSIYFEFPDLEGNLITPNDERFEGKALILQIFGTWCPNCMDETKFLTQWYNENKGRGVEILGIAYEAKDDFDYAKKRVLKMKKKLNVPYNFVIGGTLDKEEASKTLPMLNQITSFPTTIFIDKEGKVQRIHTGFTGPGTGMYYEQFIKEFNETIDELVAE
jgi:thiol-disulfide isomerase/thioredoxin